MGGLLLGPMASYHFDRDASLNEAHPAIGYVAPSGWGGGVYKNSLGKTSVYAGKEFRWPLNGLLDAGLQVGGVTGYPMAPIVPAILPGLIGKLGDHELSLMLMPPAGKHTSGGVVLQYRKKLK